MEGKPQDADKAIVGGKRPDPDFDPFSCLPRAIADRRLRKVRITRTGLGPLEIKMAPFPLMVVLAILALILTAVLNMMQGTLGTPSIDVLYNDMRAALRLESSARNPDFEVLRDGASLAQGMLLILFVGVLFRQWQLIESLLGDLSRSNAIQIIPERQEAFTRDMREVNDGFARLATVRSSASILGGCVLAGIAFLLVTRRFGVFAALASGDPPPRATFAKAAYESWWAGLRYPWLGATGYLVLLSGGLYLLLLQNIVGAKALRFLLRHKADIAFAADRLNRDGHYGWRTFRRLLVTIYVCVLIHALILLMFFIVMPLEGVAVLLGIAFASLLFLYPIYLVVPVVWTRREMLRYREQLVADIDESYNRARQGMSLSGALELEHQIRSEISTVHAIPPSPFRIRQILTGGVVYLLPATLGVIQIAQLVI